MTFKIIVFVKQVPDTDDIKWTEHNTIQREGLDSIINPYDVAAIQLAKNVKFILKDCKILVVSMGPKQAENVLKEALAMGCDEAYLLCDKKFAGSDTLATAYVLSQFVKTQCSDFNLIVCGQQAIDGDTAQTPSSMAEKLGIPQACNVTALKDIDLSNSVWIRDTNLCTQQIKLSHPCLISTSLKNVDILPDINGYIGAQNANVVTLTAEDLFVDIDKIGIKGSPTQVKAAYRPVIERNTVVFEAKDADTIADFIISEINNCKVQND